MMEPRHHLCDALGAPALRHVRSRDHDDGKAKQPCRIDLGPRAGATGVSGHEPRHGFRAQQRKIALLRERAARNDHLRIRQRHRVIRLVDETQQVPVLGLGGERFEVLPPDSEKHARWLDGQGVHGGLKVRHRVPTIIGVRRPLGANEGNERRCRLGAGRDRVPAHDIGERMRRIDDVGDCFGANKVREPATATEPTRANRERLIDGHLRAAGIRVDGVEAGVRHSSRERVRITCATEYEDADHG